MLELNIDVKKNICNISQPTLTSGCVNAVACLFSFDDNWNGYELTASFESAYGTYHCLIENGKCNMPNAIVAHASSVKIGVIGKKGNITITTNTDTFFIDEGANKDGIKDPYYQPTLLEQILSITEKCKLLAQSLRDDANAGKFNGKDYILTDADKTEIADEAAKKIAITPQNYGAKADGITDDTAAIQAAFDACHEAGGGTVHLPKGTYLLGDAVKFYSNMHIIGNDAVFLQKDGNVGLGETTYCNLMRNYNTGIGGYDNTENVIIEGITFDGGAQETSPTSMLCFCHSRNITVKNCMFTSGYSDSASSAHDIECNSSKSVVIENCRFIGNRRTKSTAELIQLDALEMSVRYPWPTDNGAQGAFDGTACEDVTIDGCTFVGHHGLADEEVLTIGNVFIGNHTTIKSENIRISNNYFKTGFFCVYFTGAKNVIVSDNRVENVYRGFGVTNVADDDESYSINNLVIGTPPQAFSTSNFVEHGSMVSKTLRDKDVVLEKLGDIGDRTMKEYTDTEIAKLKQDPVLIETIEVTEEGVTAVARTKEPDGTPYNFKSIEFYINQKKGANNGQGGLIFDIKEAEEEATVSSPLLGIPQGAFSSTSDSYTMCRAGIRHSNLHAETTTKSSSSASYLPVGLYVPDFAITNSVKAVSIHGFKYYSLNGYVIPVGTTIEIWGESNA